MGYPKRTAYCEKCGSVGFKIKQGSGTVDYVCSECYSNLSTTSCKDYETLEPICKQCNSDVFKIKIQEHQGEEQWSVRCVNCEAPPSVIYVDEDGVEVDRILRELLVIKKCIANLEYSIAVVSGDVKKLNCCIDEINNNVDKREAELDEIHSRINKVNLVMEKQKIKTINLDDEVSKIRNRLNAISNY